MTKEDVGKMLYMIRAAYPNQFKGYNDRQMQDLFDVWYMVFEDKNPGEAFKGLKIFLNSDTKGFVPSPGQIVNCMSVPKYANEFEAWTLVDKAVRNSGYNSEEEFNKLPQLIRRVVRNPARLKEWAMMDIGDYQTVEQSNFMRAYRAEVERDKDLQKIPVGLRPQLDTIPDIDLYIEEKHSESIGKPPDDLIEELIKSLS